MLELYYFLGATCGLKARLALSEKKVSYKHNVVDRKFLKTDKYRKLNPNGVVPTLIPKAFGTRMTIRPHGIGMLRFYSVSGEPLASVRAYHSVRQALPVASDRRILYGKEV